eukprot:938843-Pyramimonas_sp.AAC.1
MGGVPGSSAAPPSVCGGLGRPSRPHFSCQLARQAGAHDRWRAAHRGQPLFRGARDARQGRFRGQAPWGAQRCPRL